jgi:hypothetical protein
MEYEDLSEDNTSCEDGEIIKKRYKKNNLVKENNKISLNNSSNNILHKLSNLNNLKNSSLNKPVIKDITLKLVAPINKPTRIIGNSTLILLRK